jgi:hypothetical protein
MRLTQNTIDQLHLIPFPGKCDNQAQLRRQCDSNGKPL